MNPFDIFITYVSWGNDGKIRPVLVLERQDTVVFVFSITSRYEGKSESIRAGYYRINDWREAGLDRPSHVDTNNILDLPLLVLAGKTPIGRLTAADEARLIEFIG